MRALGMVIVLLLACGAALRALVQAVRRRDKRDELSPGSVVLVRTPERKTLLATVRSRGPSHFWIELPPADARFWVPASAVRPAPTHARLANQLFKSTLQPAPRRMLDSEI